MAFGKRTLRPALGPLLAVGSLVVLTWASYAWVKQRQLDELHRTLDSRAELYAASIGGALNKYEFLPLAVAQSDAVAQLLEQPSAAAMAALRAASSTWSSSASTVICHCSGPRARFTAR